MSREDLVQAYIDGQISRRVFVRRLVAAGVGLTAALTYAEINAAEARAGDRCDPRDHYDHRRRDKRHKDHGGHRGRGKRP